MRRLLLILAFIMMASCNNEMAQDYSGSYTLVEMDEIKLELEHSGDENYTGELSGTGTSFNINGAVQENGFLTGTVESDYEALNFEASLNEEYLTFTMLETDENGQSIPASAEILRFQKGNLSPDTNPSQTGENPVIVINNVTLSEDQIAELTQTYGIKPLPGNYWYDTRSGLYGVVGHPAYGFMYPGHNFGTLKRDASNGNTGVIVNNRELPQAEWTVWSYMLGSWIQMGSYWLDGNGNAGYEGNPTPVVNLYVAAQQNSYNGQGGSGDNFWSSRFSAGNYDSGNQRGYVSVPGHGPVGYGF